MRAQLSGDGDSGFRQTCRVAPVLGGWRNPGPHYCVPRPVLVRVRRSPVPKIVKERLMVARVALGLDLKQEHQCPVYPNVQVWSSGTGVAERDEGSWVVLVVHVLLVQLQVVCTLDYNGRLLLLCFPASDNTTRGMRQDPDGLPLPRGRLPQRGLRILHPT